jgi:ethylmalonyl-CoA/methylmalonyl-CoA decarboxylase
MHDTVTRLANLPLISVCLVRGRAIGGGAELTLSTDFRAFAPSGKLNFVQARLGVLPGWAGGSKLVISIHREFLDPLTSKNAFQ